ncbi:hypothetical protein Q3G72_000079 [Acer saccharum]|nr:hypothetical protein Q3G72_000079 [Acer saccharum]
MRDRERGTRSNPSASCRLQLLVFCFDSTPPPSVHNGAVNGGRPSLVDARVCRPPLTLIVQTDPVCILFSTCIAKLFCAEILKGKKVINSL